MELEKPQQQPSQKSEQEISKEEIESLEEQGYEVHNPVIIHDGSCKHYFVEDGIDGEGKGQAACRDCWQGRFYDVTKQKVSDGRITDKKS
jgi:hypothetical protein